MLRTCLKCGVTKALDEFSLHPKGRDGRNPRCKACKNKEAAEYYQRNKTKMKARRAGALSADWERDIRRKFGLSADQYANLLAEQGGMCYICEAAPEGKRLAVDHDHQTGAVRGLLCHSCNVGLGFFRDRVDRLQRAIEYLEREPTG